MGNPTDTDIPIFIPPIVPIPGLNPIVVPTPVGTFVPFPPIESWGVTVPPASSSIKTALPKLNTSKNSLEYMTNIALNFVDPQTNTTLQSKVNTYLNTLDATTYNSMASTISLFLAYAKEIQGFRMLVAEADGRVVLDTNVGENNKFENIGLMKGLTRDASGNIPNQPLKWMINEPHGGRSNVQAALLSRQGESFLTKWSNSVKAYQSYHTLRVGPDANNPVGVLIFSANGTL